MTIIESEIVAIEKSAEHIFNFLSNFNNFKTLLSPQNGKSAEYIFGFLSKLNNAKSSMPPQDAGFQSTEDTCSYAGNGLAGIGLKIIEKIPHSKIQFSGDGKLPFHFTLTAHIEACSKNACNGQLVFEAQLSKMMKMMIKKPLTNFVNQLAEKMKDI